MWSISCAGSSHVLKQSDQFVCQLFNNQGFLNFFIKLSPSSTCCSLNFVPSSFFTIILFCMRIHVLPADSINCCWIFYLINFPQPLHCLIVVFPFLLEIIVVAVLQENSFSILSESISSSNKFGLVWFGCWLLKHAGSAKNFIHLPIF